MASMPRSGKARTLEALVGLEVLYAPMTAVETG
jgi:hypothetical protein